MLAEPGGGIEPIYQLITAAHSSVDLTMYELADPVAEADLAADSARGVDVRVLLDQHLEKSANTAAYSYLARPGRDRYRRRLLAYPPDRRLGLCADLPQRPTARRADHRDRRGSDMPRQELTCALLSLPAFQQIPDCIGQAVIVV